MVAMVNSAESQEFEVIEARTVQTTVLKGLDAIAEYMGCSRTSALKLIREQGFPAAKLLKRWESDVVLVEKWRIDYIDKYTKKTESESDAA